MIRTALQALTQNVNITVLPQIATSDWMVPLAQVIISLGGAGLIVQLLLLKSNRRKIAGDASSQEANAASTLSGAAMRMVENAQLREREAEARSEVDRKAREECMKELEVRSWRVHNLEVRVAVLVDALRQAGVPIPPEVLDERPA